MLMNGESERRRTARPESADFGIELDSQLSGEEGCGMSSLITTHNRCRSCSASFSHPPTTVYFQWIGTGARSPSGLVLKNPIGAPSDV